MVLVALGGVILWQYSSGMLAGRLAGTFNSKEDVASAYGSSQARQELFWRSIEVTVKHPLFGIGPGNFAEISGHWSVTHNSFTQMSSEGGVLAFILYVLILSRGFKNARATKQSTKGKGELTSLAKALQASLAAYVIGSLFASSAYQFFPYFLVAYTTVLFLIAKKSASNSKEHELRAKRCLRTKCMQIRLTPRCYGILAEIATKRPCHRLGSATAPCLVHRGHGASGPWRLPSSRT